MPGEMNGVFIVDKPEGVSSAGVVRVLKRRLGLKKIGHGGTLDPFATGVLIALVGKGTKLSSLFLEGDKRYSGTVRLGVGTTTDDITGEVVRTESFGENLGSAEHERICRELEKRFTGSIEQLPPVVSALKVGGERSYRLARKGLSFERRPRAVTIYSLSLSFAAKDLLRYSMHCSKGTYVRSLGRDFGEYLGTVGCVETLRREESSGFSVAESVRLDDLTEESAAGRLIPSEIILERLSGKLTGADSAPRAFVHSRDLL